MYSAGDSFNETEVRSLLQKQLPDYMLPSVIEKMNRFPVTANGKIDRNKLKNRQSQGVQPARTEPANKAERDVEGCFRKLLESDRWIMKKAFSKWGSIPSKQLSS